MNLCEYLKTNRAKLIKTFFCYVSFFGLGGCCTLLGSSLLDLSISLNAEFKEVSGLVPSRSIGYIIGAVLSGFVGKFAGPDLILFLTNLTAGIFIALAPWFRHFAVIYTCLLLSGISQGIFDIFTNTYTLAIWGDKATNYVQILHGSFGLGSLLTPLLIKPFLLPLAQNEGNETQSDAFLGDYTPDDVIIQYPFIVVGVLLIFASSGFLVFHFKRKSSEKDKQSVDVKPEVDHPKWKIVVSLTALALIAHTTFGVETLIGSLAPSFVVISDLKMSKQDGANMVTMFWSLFTFYRLFFIAATSCIKERYMMYFNYCILITAIVMMCISGAYNQLIAWISIGLLGIGFSPTFSVSLGLLQKYINISNKYASFIFITAAVGESIHPWIVTKFMDSMPAFFIYYTAAVSFGQLALCFILPFILKSIFRKDIKFPLDRSASIRSSQR
ncbi:sodium-dependent glucose transporter 1-like [Tetranychus urticae]|uniref:Major facilitator superfamily (MFS) profile domain-containing protein n=1 Tax=Tetranychus urticae TaxID=32264 RepID=T1JRE3_TETUR|nr:sodium-dependent glucose transporter 1-like [Tetranychus urticae]